MQPMLDTERLHLRPPRADDLDALHAWRSDPSVVRFVGGRTLDREEAWQRLLRAAGHRSLFGHGLFMVEEKAGGAVIGEVGLFYGRRGLGPDFDAAPEIGWILAAGAQGRGYATEAALAAQGWFAATQGDRRCVCMIDPAHDASFRVAAKLGYKRYRSADYQGGSVTLLERMPA
jgi:RimJ/RimL family protein N-acetyltransferase